MTTLFAISWIVLSFAITYAWWVDIRVWLYRQKLFRIRDNMWYAMREKGTLDDPSHRSVRDAINGLIRFAPRASLFTFRCFESMPVEHRINMDDMPNEVRQALVAAVRVSAEFVLFSQLSGLCYFAWHWFKSKRDKVVRDFGRMIRRAVDTEEMRTVDWERGLLMK